MNKNLVSFTFKEENFNSLKEQIIALQLKIDEFAVDLHLGDMRELKTLGDRSLAFTEQAYLLASQQNNLIPSYISYDEFTKDMNLFKQSNELIKMMEVSMERLKDTYYAAGHDAFYAARKIYEYVKAATKSGTPGAAVAFDELNKRYKRLGLKNKDQETSDETKTKETVKSEPSAVDGKETLKSD